MRDFKGMKRQRSRNRNPGSGGGGGGGARPQQHNANRAFDSNGPEGTKVRGAAQHVYEKYQQLARDAQTAGDRVLAENYLQHAEHYFRLLRAMQPLRPLSEIIGRDQFVSGYDIDFEDESGAEAAQAESEVFQDQPAETSEGERPRLDRQNDYRRDERPRDEPRYQGDRNQADRGQNDRPQNDRYQGDRPQNDRYQGDRNQNDRYQGDRQNDRYQADRAQGGQDRQQGDRPRDDRQRNDRQQGDRQRDDRGQRPYRDDRPRYDRDERVRDDRPRDDRVVTDRVEPEPAAAPIVAPRVEAPSQPVYEAPEAPSVLRADDGEVSAAPAFLQVRATEGEEPRRPRRRRAPASFEPIAESAPDPSADG